MTEQIPARPLYLDTAREPVFGFHHAATGETPSGIGVVIAGPWGWDEVVTYRSRRDWAEDLATAGHSALRIDLPGAGDSAGSDADDDRLGAWAAGIVAAVAFLRELPSCRRVAVIGMGLGGLSAARAIDQGVVVDDLVLWAAPTTGRAFLREMRAFGSLQATRFSLTGEPEPRVLPEGWMEVGGFVLSATTIAALEGLDLSTWSFDGLGRALLLDRDGLPVDKALAARLGAGGASVVVGSGAGWADMTYDIERHRPPLGVFATVAAFLAAAADEANEAVALAADPSPRPAPDATPAGARIRVGSTAVRETPITMPAAAGRTFGILAEPDAATPSEMCAIFLNAGAVRRIGPNRMWVEAARRWAARGIPSLRLDIEAIGDADGDPSPFVDVNAFYRAGLEAQIVAAMDLLSERGLGNRFVLVGLCSGAYWAFQVAVADERVAAIAMLNPRGLIWDPHLFVRLASRDARKVLQRASWGRFLRGQIGPRRVAGVARTVAVRIADAVAHRVARRLPGGSRQSADTVEGLLAQLDRRGTRVVLAFSDEEPLCAHLEDEGLPARFRRWPRAAFVRLPGRDHTVRPVVAQVAVQALLDEVVDRAIDERAVPEVGSGQDARRVAQPSSPTP
jgi:dienelactone hydrolase